MWSPAGHPAGARRSAERRLGHVYTRNLTGGGRPCCDTGQGSWDSLDLVWRTEMSKGWIMGIVLGVALAFCVGCEQKTPDKPTTTEAAKESKAAAEEHKPADAGPSAEQQKEIDAAKAEGERRAKEAQAKAMGGRQ